MSFACNWCWRPGYAHEGIIITSRKSTIWSFPSRHSIKSNYKCHYKGIDNDTLREKKDPCRYYPVMMWAIHFVFTVSHGIPSDHQVPESSYLRVNAYTWNEPEAAVKGKQHGGNASVAFNTSNPCYVH